ncbi:MAG: response regulator [Anaerolineales bacterium]|nr:response regulator [Anaerolineales bacterium]MCB8966065.1 response regulator [Ardenticatenaceae bacterium]
MGDAPLILYVEDNLDNRKLVSRVLRASGFEFHGVEDGKGALAYLAEQTPDLILMDINLPEIDGYTMTQQLRQIDKLATIPIVAMTANVMKADREKSVAAGCDGFIQKPINVDLLPDQIREYLSRNKLL